MKTKTIKNIVIASLLATGLSACDSKLKSKGVKPKAIKTKKIAPKETDKKINETSIATVENDAIDAKNNSAATSATTAAPTKENSATTSATTAVDTKDNSATTTVADKDTSAAKSSILPDRQKTIDELTTERSKIGDELTSLNKSKIGAAPESLVEISETIAALNTKQAKLTAEISALEKKEEILTADQLKTKIKNKQTLIDRFEEERSSIGEELINLYTSKNKPDQSNANELQKSIDRLNQEQAYLTNEIRLAQNEIANTKKELASVQIKDNEKDIEALRKSVLSYGTLLDDLSLLKSASGLAGFKITPEEVDALIDTDNKSILKKTKENERLKKYLNNN